MDYFKYFPTVEYGKSTVVNITARSKIKDYIKNNIYYYYPYALTDGERPDTFAERYYGSWKYAWLVLYANDIFDPIRDWVMTEREFNKFLNYKYSFENAVELGGVPAETLTGMENYSGFEIAHQTIHHYENSFGYVVDLNDWYYETVSELSRQPYDWSQYNNIQQVVRIRNQNGIPTFIKMKTINAVKVNDKTLTGSFNTNLAGRLVGINRINRENIALTVLSNTNTTMLFSESLYDIEDGATVIIWYFNTNDIKSNEFETQRYNPNTFTSFSFNDSSKKVVSNYRYEYDKNEARRTIKVIDKAYLSQIVNEFRILFGE